MRQTKIGTKRLAQGAVIAALYVALTLIFAPISFGAVQLRVSEALTILPLFTPAAIPGLFVGCVLANLIAGAVVWDVVFGSLATLIGAAVGYALRRNRWLVPIPAILANTLVIPFVLRYGYGMRDLPLWLSALYILIGEILSCYVLGELLAAAPLTDSVKQQVEDGDAALADAEAQLTAAQQQLADAEQQLTAAETQLADGKAQLKQFEDGRDQIIDAASQVVANPADKGLTSIKDRLGEGFTFVKENGDLDIPGAKKVSEAWHAYSKDSGDAITKEVVTRVVGIGLILLAALIALIAGIRGLTGKGGKLASCIAFLLGGAGVAALFIGGDYFTQNAAKAAKFNAFAPIILAGGIAVAAMALIHIFAAPKAAKK